MISCGLQASRGSAKKKGHTHYLRANYADVKESMCWVPCVDAQGGLVWPIPCSSDMSVWCIMGHGCDKADLSGAGS